MKITHNKKLKKFIVQEGTKRVGYLKYNFPKDASAKNGNRNVQIEYIYVNPLHRRKGIASELMSCMLEYAKDMVWISLWTGRQAEIDKSFSLYRKFGFKQKSVQEDYYEKGVSLRLFVRRMYK